jgi:CobQ-like glutamine amidotransferase family enzyme
MILEVLYPELANLYGDKFNILYLCQTVKNIEVVETHLGDTPAFLGDGNKKPDLVYRGQMAERDQKLMINELLPYADNFDQAIKNGTRFLFTGNAVEVLGKSIRDQDDQVLDEEDRGGIKCLDILPFVTKRQMFHRKASLYHGKYEDIDVIGYKASFTEIFPYEDIPCWIRTVKGPGLNPELADEGFNVNNFFSSSILGPLLIINPYLCKRFLAEFLPEEDFELPYEKEAIEAYNRKKKTILDPKTVFKF